MARLLVGGDDLRIHLSFLGRVGAFIHGDGSVPLSAIRAVRVTDDPWAELRGIRSPGVNLRGVIALGTRRHPFGRDFVAVYGRGPAVVVELAGVEFSRLVISSSAAGRVADDIRSAVGELRPPAESAPSEELVASREALVFLSRNITLRLPHVADSSRGQEHGSSPPGARKPDAP